MASAVRDFMTTEVQTVGPEFSLADLDRVLVEHRIGGVPVIKGGKLVGVVSRADVTRQLAIEQSLAEQAADFYRDPGWPTQSLAEIGALSGQQLQSLKVADLMTDQLITVAPDAPLHEAASRMLEHQIHRLLVTEGDTLLGVLAAQDLVRAIAEGRVG